MNTTPHHISMISMHADATCIADKKAVLKYHPDKKGAMGEADQALSEAQFVSVKKGKVVC